MIRELGEIPQSAEDHRLYVFTETYSNSFCRWHAHFQRRRWKSQSIYPLGLHPFGGDWETVFPASAKIQKPST